jgi:hypothetical protein
VLYGFGVSLSLYNTFAIYGAMGARGAA